MKLEMSDVIIDRWRQSYMETLNFQKSFEILKWLNEKTGPYMNEE